MKTLPIDGSTLSYAEQGPADAPAVVLLHGYAGSHLTWRHVIPALAATHRVVALDWLGWGDSGHPLDVPLDFEAEVDRLGRVLDALELPRCALAAHDYGGLIGLGLAQRHPQRLCHLALLNTRAHRSFTLRWYATFGLVSRVCRVPGLRALFGRFPLRALHRLSLLSERRRGVLDEPTLRSYFDWMSTPQGRRFYVRFMGSYRVAPRPELSAGLRSIACPTTVIWGAHDPYLSADIARSLADEIPGATLHLLDAGHFVAEEHPEPVADALRELLARPGATDHAGVAPTSRD